MNPRTIGLILVAAGIGIVLVGLLVWSGGLAWLGRLPGDIRIEHETTRVYIPITSMLIVSAVLSLIVWIVRHFV